MGSKRERRDEHDVDAFGKAWVILEDEKAVAYQLDSLSQGGALLSGGPPLPWGETFAVVFRVEGLPALEATGRVSWEQGNVVGISFVSLDARAADAIEDVVLALIDEQHPPLFDAALERDASAKASWLP